jgi:hypothetical protein
MNRYGSMEPPGCDERPGEGPVMGAPHRGRETDLCRARALCGAAPGRGEGGNPRFHALLGTILTPTGGVGRPV